MKMQDRINEIIYILNNVKYDEKGLTTNVKRYDYTTDKWCKAKDDLLDFSTNSICICFKFKDILKYIIVHKVEAIFISCFIVGYIVNGIKFYLQAMEEDNFPEDD